LRQTIFYIWEGGEPCKWQENRPHSAEARALRRSAKTAFNGRNFKIGYDHAIPLSTLRQKLFDASASTDEMRRVLERHIVGVVLCRHENDSLKKCGLECLMPQGCDPGDALARYRVAEIGFEPDDQAKLARNSN
jgi:hypothetical protein